MRGEGRGRDPRRVRRPYLQLPQPLCEGIVSEVIHGCLL
jgi:hypothetical protein